LSKVHRFGGKGMKEREGTRKVSCAGHVWIEGVKESTQVGKTWFLLFGEKRGGKGPSLLLGSEIRDTGGGKKKAILCRGRIQPTPRQEREKKTQVEGGERLIKNLRVERSGEKKKGKKGLSASKASKGRDKGSLCPEGKKNMQMGAGRKDSKVR